MNGIDYLIDTNIIIYYFEGVLTESARIFVDNILKRGCNISAITKIELLGWRQLSEEKNMMLVEFVNHAVVIGISDEIINQTVEIRKTGKLKIPDAIIAATAILKDWELVTRNVSDFKNVSGLKIVNPFEI